MGLVTRGVHRGRGVRGRRTLGYLSGCFLAIVKLITRALLPLGFLMVLIASRIAAVRSAGMVKAAGATGAAILVKEVSDVLKNDQSTFAIDTHGFGGQFLLTGSDRLDT